MVWLVHALLIAFICFGVLAGCAYLSMYALIYEAWKD